MSSTQPTTRARTRSTTPAMVETAASHAQDRAKPIAQEPSTVLGQRSSRKPFNPLPLSMFPCKLDLYSSASLATSSQTATLGSRSPRSIPTPSSAARRSATKERPLLKRTDIDGSARDEPSMDMQMVAANSDQESWEAKSPARRLFVGNTGQVGSPVVKRHATKSKLSTLLLEDDSPVPPSLPSSSDVDNVLTPPPPSMGTTPRGGSGKGPHPTLSRPFLRPSPPITDKDESSHCRTWGRRDSPSASPISNKKFRPDMGLMSSLEDEDGDKTITELTMGQRIKLDDGNADTHATGFSIWDDRTTTEPVPDRRRPEYFDLDFDGVIMAGVSTAKVGTPGPKYTAENIRFVGRDNGANKAGPSRLPSTPTTATTSDDVGQENIPPAGWIDLADLNEDKDKTRCCTPSTTFEDRLFSSPRSGKKTEKFKDRLVASGSSSLGDQVSMSSSPASGGGGMYSSVSTSPSPVKASSVRTAMAGPFSALPPTPSKLALVTAASLPVCSEPHVMTPTTPTNNSATIEASNSTVKKRTGIKKSLTKSFKDLRGVAEMSGRVLRSATARNKEAASGL